jgi:hypothetical protein
MICNRCRKEHDSVEQSSARICASCFSKIYMDLELYDAYLELAKTQRFEESKKIKHPVELY